MKLKILILSALLICQISQTAFAMKFKKECEGMGQSECFHSQGVYTEEEFDQIDIEKFELAFSHDKNSQLNGLNSRKAVVSEAEMTYHQRSRER